MNANRLLWGICDGGIPKIPKKPAIRRMMVLPTTTVHFLAKGQCRTHPVRLNRAWSGTAGGARQRLGPLRDLLARHHDKNQTRALYVPGGVSFFFFADASVSLVCKTVSLCARVDCLWQCGHVNNPIVCPLCHCTIHYIFSCIEGFILLCVRPPTPRG